MLKRLFATITLAAFAFQGTTAHATDLDSSFNTLMTYTTPGTYSTSTRTAFTGGGIDVRFPRATSTMSLLSINPPTLPSAGCNGISAHFGGFSFVSGKQIEQLIKNIGQNAVGMVVSVVIKTLCPICDAVIQAMTKLAQDAARMSVNSCEIGSSIAASLMGTTGRGSQETVKNMCSDDMSVANNVSEDSLSAIRGVNSACGNLQNAMKWMGDKMRPTNPDGSPKAECITIECSKMKTENLFGNLTWNDLNELYGKINSDTSDDEKRNRVLLLNAIGTEIRSDVDAAGTGEYPQYTLVPQISGKDMFDLFMCGVPGSFAPGAAGSTATYAVSMKYCAKFFDSGNAQAALPYPVMDCSHDWAACNPPKSVPLASAKMLVGKGYLPQTEQILFEAVEAVRTNQGPFSPQFMAMVDQLPFPIYQAVNAAAVYPASARDLVATMSVLVAESMVSAKLEEILRPQGRNRNKAMISQRTVDRVVAFLENLQKSHVEQRASFGRLMTMQEAAVQSIRQVNLAIQKQVLTPQLLGNQKYGEAVAGSLSK